MTIQEVTSPIAGQRSTTRHADRDSKASADEGLIQLQQMLGIKAFPDGSSGMPATHDGWLWPATIPTDGSAR